MAGYYGYSMSNNAVVAYNSGEKPKSKWRKSDILEAFEHEPFYEDLKKLSLESLKSLCLEYSSWHHTSSKYNKTDFYSINYDFDRSLIAVYYQKQQEAKLVKEKPVAEYVNFKEDVWEGSKRHPKKFTYDRQGVMVGDWIYTANGKKYKTMANKNHSIEVVKKAQNDELKKLKRRLGK